MLCAGADVNKADNYEETPLYVAAENGRKDVVEVLLRAGADVNKADNDGWTPLHIAARNGHKDAVVALVDGGADPTLFTNRGQSTLDFTCGEHGVAIAHVILNGGWVDVDVPAEMATQLNNMRPTDDTDTGTIFIQ